MKAMIAKAQGELDGATAAVEELREKGVELSAKEAELTEIEQEAVSAAEIAKGDVDRFLRLEQEAKSNVVRLKASVLEAKQVLDEIDEAQDEEQYAGVMTVNEDSDALLAIGSKFEAARRQSKEFTHAALSGRLQKLLEKDGAGGAPSPTKQRMTEVAVDDDDLSSTGSVPSSGTPTTPGRPTLRSSLSSRTGLRRLSLINTKRASTRSFDPRERERGAAVLAEEEKKHAAAKRKLANATDMRAASVQIESIRENEARAAEDARAETSTLAFKNQKALVQAQASVAKYRHKLARIMEHHNILRVKIESIEVERQKRLRKSMSRLASGFSLSGATRERSGSKKSVHFEDDEEEEVEERMATSDSEDGAHVVPHNVLGSDDEGGDGGRDLSGALLSPFANRIRLESHAHEMASQLGDRFKEPVMVPNFRKQRSEHTMMVELENAQLEGELIT